MTPRTFWRIVRTNSPTRRDFMSHVALGIPFRATDEDAMRQAEGISVYATEAQARRKARQLPVLGAWLAELQAGDELPLTVERTSGGPGHHTIWGDPEVIASCVVRITEV